MGNSNNSTFLLMEKKNISIIRSLFLLLIFFIQFLLPLQANAEDLSNHNIFKIDSRVTVEIDEVYRTIISLNGPVDVKGRVIGNVISVGKPVYIQGLVENDVIVLGDDIVLTEGSAIRGDAITIGGEILQSHGSMIGGNLKEISLLPRWNFSVFLERLFYFVQYPIFYSGFNLPANFLFIRIVFTLTIAALTVTLLPKQVVNIANSIQHQLWKNLFIGLLAVICIIPITAFLGITIVGIPLIPILIVFLVLAGLIGGIALNYIVGYRMLSAFNIENTAMIWSVISGLFILEILRMIPLMAIIILPLLYILGLGGVIYTRFGNKMS